MENMKVKIYVKDGRFYMLTSNENFDSQGIHIKPIEASRFWSTFGDKILSDDAYKLLMDLNI